MNKLSTVAGLAGILISPAAFAANDARVALDLLLVVATLAAMLVITWRRRHIALARKRLHSRKDKRS